MGVEKCTASLFSDIIGGQQFRCGMFFFEVEMANHLKIVCPCCEAKLHVDQKTGEVVWKEEKKKDLGSISDLVKQHEGQQKEAQSLFKKQSDLQKERNRLLDEKFKEAQKHVDKDNIKPLRDFDLD